MIERLCYKILDKFLSARFICVIAFASTFCYITIKGEIPAEAFIAVLMLVLKYYFEDKRRKEDEKITTTLN